MIITMSILSHVPYILMFAMVGMYVKQKNDQNKEMARLEKIRDEFEAKYEEQKVLDKAA